MTGDRADHIKRGKSGGDEGASIPRLEKDNQDGSIPRPEKDKEGPDIEKAQDGTDTGKE